MSTDPQALPRAPHYLRKSRHAGFPRRQVALTVAWDRVKRPGASGIADDLLLSWRAVSWTGPPGQEEWAESGDGTDADSWWRWLDRQLRPRQSVWVWSIGTCHALTLLGFWRLLDAGRWQLSKEDGNAADRREDEGPARGAGLCVLEDTPTVILALPVGRTGSARFLDIRNYGIANVRELGIGPDDPRALAAWVQTWTRTVEALNLGGLRCTAAAQAWHGWRYSYLKSGVLVHGCTEAAELERASIYPGRAEAFRLGVVPGPVWQVDARSHYPACAIAGPLPVRLRWCGACALGDVESAVKRGWLAIVRARVKCPRPLLPHRRRAGTVWPVGEWRVALPWPELLRAIAGGCAVSVDAAALYEGGMPLTPFVFRLHGARAVAEAGGRLAEAVCIKLLLNSLIGKLASRSRAWVDAPGALPPCEWSTWTGWEGKPPKLVPYRSIGWHVQRLETGPETPESTPALASWIYAVSRVRLLDWIETAGWGETYYVDSDSIFTSRDGAKSLGITDGPGLPALGALRVQGVYPSLRIGGIRDYTTARGTVRAGTPGAEAVEAAGVARWWRGETVRESVHGHRAPLPVAREVVVPLTRVYRHGVVGTDGRISPLRVGDGASG